MTKRTRVFLLVASGILITGLGSGLLAAYVGGFQNLALIGSDGPDELAYVAKDARMVAYADVREIMSSELRQKLHQLQQDPNARPGNQLEAATGINLETDVDHVLASSTGGEPEQQHDRPLVLARGRFDAVRIEGLVREHGASVEEYKGKRLLTKAEERMTVSFLEPDLVAIGTPESVRRAIDTKAAGTGTVKDNSEVMRLVRDVDTGTAWAVARFDALTASGRLPDAVATQIPPINWFAVTGHVDDGLRGTLRVDARDDASAQNLREVIRGFMALARLQAGQHAELTALLDSLQLSGDGTTVTLGFSVPGETIDLLASMRPERRRGLRVPIVPGAPRRPAPARPDAPAL